MADVRRRAKALTFTRRTDADDGDDANTELELRRAAKFFKRGDLLPETVWRTANARLAGLARSLAFSTRQPYLECMRETLRKAPYLWLGTTGYLPDAEFRNVDFIDPEERDDDAT